MISFLRGTVVEKLMEGLIIDVRGIGYEVQATPRVYQRAQPGEEIVVYTHFHVREDAQILYGFVDLSERDIFRQLVTVNGVGPKTAMAILAALKPDELVRAVLEEDHARLKVPGVGPKTAKRIVLELKSSMQNLAVGDEAGGAASGGIHTDVTAALEQLGYTTVEIRDALQGLDISEYTLSEAVKVVLKTIQK